MEEKNKYRVLARKYRPQTFADLIGQDALVRTISNAIANDRLAHAYILTGIRGIGKTTSARIIARALNCVGADGNGSMTPNPCGVCKHCQDIANDCHVDVIEIDAASNTGVEHIREIIEGAKYNPLSARYKIYIIDEVHMLSKSAFNALLKTLEEPPERLKFIFATTEIRKVPVTILSRCQRFDLKRIEVQMLCDYFKTILQKEGVPADDDAVMLIAKAADGSVRDGLSLLDQAIAHGNGSVLTEQVREMIGLSDKVVLFDLYDHIMSGKMNDALTLADEQYNQGTDPLTLAEDLLDLTHFLTRVKISPDLLKDPTLSEHEKEAGKKMSENLSVSTLTRTWQMLLKGVSEIKYADNPLKTLEMLLVRLVYAAELPTPIEAVSRLSDDVQVIATPAEKKTEFLAKTDEVTPHKTEPVVQSAPAMAPNVSIKDIADIVAFAQKQGKMLLGFQISNFVRPVSIENNCFSFAVDSGAPASLSKDIHQLLKSISGDWNIQIAASSESPTLKEKAAIKKQQIQKGLAEKPIVQAVLRYFPQAKIESFTLRQTDENPLNDMPDYST